MTTDIWHSGEVARFIMPLPNGMGIRCVASPRGLSMNLLKGGEVIDIAAVFPIDFYNGHFAVCEECGYEYEGSGEGCSTCANDPRKKDMPIDGEIVESLIHQYSEEFLRGYSEAKGKVGVTYDNEDRSRSYDLGRTLGRGLLGLD
jgi:hypothetical protein